MNTPNTIRVPDDKNKSTPCRGMQLDGEGNYPSNVYHPAQVAFLVSIKRYTGRMMADIGHLPAHLKAL